MAIYKMKTNKEFRQRFFWKNRKSCSHNSTYNAAM